MNRRNSAIVRIISWSAVAIFLVVILVLGIGGRWSVFSGFTLFGFTGNRYADASRYHAGAGEIAGEEVRDLDINWINGNITVEAYDGDTVQISEKSSRNLREKEKVHYYNKGGKLIIQHQASGRSFQFFNFGNRAGSKSLVVRIPEKMAAEMGKINIDTVSSETYLYGLKSDRFNYEATSGSLEVEECQGTELSADTTSGDVYIYGSYDKIIYDAVSGNLYADMEKCPEKVDTDTTSGEIILVLPENDGFTYRKDSVSGSVNCDFEVSRDEDRGVYKDGGASFEFDTVSGDIHIKRK